MLLNLYKNSYSGLSREVWILALVMLVNRTGAMLMPFLTIIMTEGRGFSLKEAGFMMSAFGLGSILGSWLGGKLTDRIGFYAVQTWSLVLTSAMFASLAFANSLIILTLGMFALSAIADSFRPANQAAIVIYSKPKNLTRSFGLQRLAFNLGYAVGPTLGGLMIVRFGYNSIFFMSALGYFISVILLKILLPKPREEDLPQRAGKKEKQDKAASSPWQDKSYLRFLFFSLLAATGFFQLISAIPAFWKMEQSFSEFQIGLFMGLNGLIIALMEMPLLYLIEYKASKRSFMTGGALLFALSYITLIAGFSPAAAAILYISLISIGEMFFMPFASSYIGKRAPKNALGQYMGLYAMSWGIAIVLAPTGGLYLAEQWGFERLWYTSAAVCALAALGVWENVERDERGGRDRRDKRDKRDA